MKNSTQSIVSAACLVDTTITGERRGQCTTRAVCIQWARSAQEEAKKRGYGQRWLCGGVMDGCGDKVGFGGKSKGLTGQTGTPERDK